MDIRGGDGVRVSGVYFEAQAVDCISVAGRYHIIENCIIPAGGALDTRPVRLIGGWCTSIIRCTMGTGTGNRVAIHGDSGGAGAVGVHILRYGGNPVIYPFVGLRLTGPLA